jgi:hypothetical protein
MRFAWVVLVAACSSSTTKKPAEPESEGVVIASAEGTCSMQTFDPSNAACEEICTPTAPQGWAGCTKVVDSLIAQGYTCSRPSPYWCHPPAWMKVKCPPTGCAPVRARVIAISIVGTTTQIKFSAGSKAGITLASTAKLVDANNKPIPNGDITLLRVDRSVTTGSLVPGMEPRFARVFVLVRP